MPSILYCGDTELAGAASYLCGLMASWNWNFTYVPSHVPLTVEHLSTARSLFIFSDYPATQASPHLQRQVLEQVRLGAGLLMIGGWESYHGLGGDWDTTPIAEALPVVMQSVDDRRQVAQPAALVSLISHPVLEGLPWESSPPCIGGYNAVTRQEGSVAVLDAWPLRFTRAALEAREVEIASAAPLLTLGQYGQGRTAAFTSDVAPHWVGGFVDWGDGRVAAQAPGGPGIEVGNWYATFWRQLLSWCTSKEAQG